MAFAVGSFSMVRLLKKKRESVRYWAGGLTLLVLSSFPGAAFSHKKCSEAVRQSTINSTPKLNPVWAALQNRLGHAKSLKEISAIDIGNFSFVKENLIRQKQFLQSTLALAIKLGVNAGSLKQILVRITNAIKTRIMTYGEYWLIHFAMQEAADFDFLLKTEGKDAKLDEKSVRYIVDRLSQSRIDLSETPKDLNNKNKIERSLGLVHLYTDFNNPRFSDAKKAKVAGNERIPLPFFQRGFDIVELNNIARAGRVRPVEILSGIYENNQLGVRVFAPPIVDNRRMGVGKDASDHDFNHLGFEVSANATRDLGRIVFEGSENLSREVLTVLNVIYFKAWHEWGINLSAMESGTQWKMLLNPNNLREDMSNPFYLGSDPNALKSLPFIEEAVAFLKKKDLPHFWE